MTSGTINIDRSLFEHPVVGIHHPDRFIGWLWLLKEAGWKDRRKNIKGNTVLVRRGQVAHSIRFMAEALGWKKTKTERFIARLKTETMIETEIGTGQLIITICNYEQYQSWAEYRGTVKETANGTGAGQERDRSGTGAGQTITPDTPEETPEEPKKGTPRKKTSLLPEDWVLPEEWKEEAICRGCRDPVALAENFRDYWCYEAPKSKRKKVNWRTTFLNLVEKNVNGKTTGTTKFGNAKEGLTRALAAANIGPPDGNPDHRVVQGQFAEISGPKRPDGGSSGVG